MRLATMLSLLCSTAVYASAHPGARAGEAFTFKFSLGPVESGRARMSVGKATSQRGRRVIAVHGQAETSGFVKMLARMDDDYKLVFDTGNLLPMSVFETERGIRERRVRSTMDGRVASVDFWAPDKQTKGRHVFRRDARDPLSGFFALRALPLADGQHFNLDIIDGNALWRVALAAKRGIKLHLEGDAPSAAKHAAIRIDGVARRIEDDGRPHGGTGPRQVIIFLSDDDDRVLLRLEADTDLGRCALELTSYLPTAPAADERAPQLPGIELR
jgi:hypothetical protein